MPDTDLKVGTVEEFQGNLTRNYLHYKTKYNQSITILSGQERPIILVSMVRTEEKYFNSDVKFELGFLPCPKRTNVTISRARSLLVVFGKAELLRKYELWRSLIDYTIQHGTYFEDNRV